MIIPIRLYKWKRILKDQWTLLVSSGVFFLLLIVVFFFYARFNTQKKEVELMTGEVQMLKNRYDILKYNKSLTEDQIKEYNKLLASLVPETEDFFSIIYALEEISTVSRFTITDYTIDVGKTTSERLTLSVKGDGNPDIFFKFLQEYEFAGGRLITSDKIQYSDASGGNTLVNLTFYNKRYTFNESVQVPQLSKEQIAKLEAIKQKVRFQFNANSTDNTDYPVKKDPFAGE